MLGLKLIMKRKARVCIGAVRLYKLVIVNFFVLLFSFCMLAFWILNFWYCLPLVLFVANLLYLSFVKFAPNI